MSQHKQSVLDSDHETLQAILRAVASVQNETGFGSIEITVHEGRVTQIEKREKFRITPEKSEKQAFNKLTENGQNPIKSGLEKHNSEGIQKHSRELSGAFHN